MTSVMMTISDLKITNRREVTAALSTIGLKHVLGACPTFFQVLNELQCLGFVSILQGKLVDT